MANDFYTKTGSPSTGSAGASATIRSEYSSIEAGFDKMPLLTSNGNQIVSVNAGGTALESTTAAIARSKLGVIIGSNVQAFNNELTGLSTLNNNGSVGIVVRTGTNNYTTRVLTGTANQVTVANGNGAAGNQTLSLPNPLNVNNIGATTVNATTSVLTPLVQNANSLVLEATGAVSVVDIKTNNAVRWECDQDGSFYPNISGTQELGVSTRRIETGYFVNINANGPILGGPTMLSPVNNSLAANVPLNNISVFFDGPSVAQGNVGTWFASGKILLSARSANAAAFVQLWDGTTVIDSAQLLLANLNIMYPVSLSGYISAPSGNVRISAKSSSIDSNIVFNASGAGKDSTITAIRIG